MHYRRNYASNIHYCELFQTIKLISGGSKGGAWRTHAPPPRHPNSFNFMQFLGEFGKIVCSRPPPWRVHAPPWGNPGSVTANWYHPLVPPLSINTAQTTYCFYRTSSKPVQPNWSVSACKCDFFPGLPSKERILDRQKDCLVSTKLNQFSPLLTITKLPWCDIASMLKVWLNRAHVLMLLLILCKWTSPYLLSTQNHYISLSFRVYVILFRQTCVRQQLEMISQYLPEKIWMGYPMWIRKVGRKVKDYILFGFNFRKICLTFLFTSQAYLFPLPVVTYAS